MPPINDPAARAPAARAAPEKLKQRRARLMERLAAARAEAGGETFVLPADLVREMLSLLEVDQPESLSEGEGEARRCPLCGSPIDDVRGHRT